MKSYKEILTEKKAVGEYMKLSSQRIQDLMGTVDKKGKYTNNIAKQALIQTANPHNQFLVMELKDGTKLIDDQRGGVLYVDKWFDFMRWIKRQTELITKTKGKS
jgi:hypothetical protein